jgi:hypothetical protein
VPGEPTKVKGYAGNKQATLTWEEGAAVAGAVVTQYQVHRYGVSDVTLGADARSYVWKGLKNDATYTLYVRAGTAAGAWSDWVSAQARPTKITPKTYKNCKKLNKVYPHGVGKKGAKDKVKGGGDPVTDFTVSKKVNKLNTKLDRDKDKIACEAA